MTVAFGVDALHLPAEEFAMRRGVMELIDSDIVMNHLMEDGILNELLGHIKTGVDAEDKMVIGPRTEEPFAMFDEGEFAEESAGIGEFNRDRRQGTAEKAGIELIKTGLDVINRGDQGDLRFDI